MATGHVLFLQEEQQEEGVLLPDTDMLYRMRQEGVCENGMFFYYLKAKLRINLKVQSANQAIRP